MRVCKLLAFAALLALESSPAPANGVPNPINAPAAVTSGNVLTATSNPQQAADATLSALHDAAACTT